MSLLTDGLPYGILIDGKVYDINADYQTCLKIIMAFEDKDLTQAEKITVLIDLLYKDKPDNIPEAVKNGIRFLDCGEKTDENGSTGDSTRKYSFTYDEKYIFSGVDKVLNGRLSKGDFIHWWEFVFAFMELPEDCTMSKIIYYRTQFAKGKLTKDEVKFYHENKELFELPIELSAEEEEKKEKFMQLLR